MDTKTSILATKEDVAGEFGVINAKIETSKAELIKDAANNKAELIKAAANNRAILIKWMFVFWISQLAAMFGFILLFLKK
ncbi:MULTISPECIES: hypothetical protein [Niastella]|uniref:Integrase n=1 Tax=Niastella soli TaxID=2821487 RepID=A0ABS3YMZ7_9BACT|nr:hypothetical protein [Niastella soli]MBO9199224.1 hypothetical protein [Niastella soli]